MNPRVAMAGGCMAAALVLVGCKTTVDQQLLERELRLQEDQIYQLQDELVSRQAQLQRSEGENASLRKQLGIVDADTSLPKRIDLPPGAASPAPVTAPSVTMPDRPTLVPPVVVPPTGAPGAGGLRFGPPSSPPGAAPPAVLPGPPPTAPGRMAPPTLDGVPPLPGSPSASAGNGSGDRAALPAIRRLSHEETIAAQGSIAALVINPGQTACFDRNGDGSSDGLNLVIEPRDGAGRLVAAGGDLSIMVYDESVAPPVVPASTEAAPEPAAALPPAEACVARFTIAEAEANGHFRGTSRARGLHFSLPWPGRVPQADHVRVLVTLATADGRSFTTDALVATR